MVAALVFAACVGVIFALGWSLGSWRGYDRGWHDALTERRLRGR